VDVHAAYEAVVFGDAVVLDVREVREYDAEHLTKPPRRCFNVPFSSAQPEVFAAAASKALGRPLTRSVLLLTATGGPVQLSAAEALAEHAGYTNVISLDGGWAEWRKHYTATSRPTPPPGRWVPTGQEALKSGLMSGDAAISYEERLNVEDLTKVGYDKKN
jgi:rhodanese-related sulfurtransferase